MPDLGATAIRRHASSPFRPAAIVLAAWFAGGCATTPSPSQPTEAAVATPPMQHYPATRSVDHKDTYHGVEVRDPGRWLEDLGSSEVHDWVSAQNALSEPYLSSLPAFEPLRARMAALWNFERWGASLSGTHSFEVPVVRGGRLFYLYNSGAQDQSVLVVADGADGTPHPVLDPNAFAIDRTVAVSAYAVSPDGRFVAYATADGGSDWKTVHVRDVDAARDLDETLGLVKFTPLSWTPDSKGFYYSRYPLADGERGDDTKQVAVWYHVLGTPQDSDRFVYAITDHATRNPYATVSDDGRWLVLSISDGFASNGVYLLDAAAPDAETLRLLDRWDARYEYLGNEGRQFYFLTTAGAPHGRIVAIDLDHPEPADWQVRVAEREDVIDGASYAGGHFVVRYLHDAHSLVRLYDAAGGDGRELPLPGLGEVLGLAGRARDTVLYYAYTDFLTPHALYRLDLATGQSTLFRKPAIALDSARYVTEQVFVASRDGTRVPVYLTHRRDMPRDGRRPTFLYGYGGFNVPLLPNFSVPVAVWLEQGGVYAVANLRGGSEYGEAWHRAGTRAQKQNVFDDFIAVSEWLIAQRITSREHLAIRGRSNGGLLVGAVLVQRPDLYAAALPAVGVLDMLRYHTASANARQWSTDYGLAEDATDFKALKAYSPVHNVRAGTCYPATLVTTAERDDRVVPWHSYKFAAALQAAAPPRCASPLLLRVETRAGHGNDRPVWMQVEDYAQQWAFAARFTGLEVKP
jgi:prolyl oligopeptidase